MSFHSGRISYCKFHVRGEGPRAVDDAALSILGEHAFREAPVGVPEEAEVGWVTGDHLLDTGFTFEKNGYGAGGSILLAAMRIDTHKVPSELRSAYRKINEQAAASGNPSGFASKAQKHEAQDLAGRQVHEDLAAGRFRRSCMVPVLWDFSRQRLYCGSTGSTAIEQLSRLMRESFGVELEYLSAGTLASLTLRAAGHGRDYEDLRPSAFTPPPPPAREAYDDVDSHRDLNIPSVPWVVQSTDLKDFLGNEFLLWLWWLTETRGGAITAPIDGRSQEFFIAIDKALDMDCAWGACGKQMLRGSGPTRLPEAGEGLATGKWPRKLGMILSDGEHQWELAVHGDRMMVHSASLPEIPDATGPREILDARIDLITRLDASLDALFSEFLRLRTAGGWASKRTAIREWITTRRKRGAGTGVAVAAP